MVLALAKFEGGNASTLCNETAQLFEEMCPAAVCIECVWGEVPNETIFKGGGVIVHERGLVLTSIDYDAIPNLKFIITFNNHKKRRAKLFLRGEEEYSGLTLLEPLEPLDEPLDEEVVAKYARITSDELMLFEEVLAIGDRFDHRHIRFCFTRPYLANVFKGRYLFFNLNYHDGCPLFNAKGELVGLLDGENAIGYKQAWFGAELKRFCERVFSCLNDT